MRWNENKEAYYNSTVGTHYTLCSDKGTMPLNSLEHYKGIIKRLPNYVRDCKWIGLYKVVVRPNGKKLHGLDDKIYLNHGNSWISKKVETTL